MPAPVIDDHLLRDVLAGSRGPDLDGVGHEGIATTGMWLFRLFTSFADPAVVGKLSAPVALLPEKVRAVFRARLVALPADIEILPLREIAWSRAVLQKRHRAERRTLSAAMVEALAAAHRFGGGIAVSRNDVGPNLRAASEAEGLAFHIL